MAKGTDEGRFELLPGTLELMLLKQLAAGELHGFAIVRRIRERSGGALRVEEGSLYPALHRMERRKWIAARWGLSESNRRAKYYRLTPAGRRELAAQERSWQRMSGAIAQVLGLSPGGAPLAAEG